MATKGTKEKKPALKKKSSDNKKTKEVIDVCLGHGLEEN